MAAALAGTASLLSTGCHNMKHYALIESGIVREIIAPLYIDGKAVPMEQCYPTEMIVNMVEIPEDRTIKPGDEYRNGLFIEKLPEAPPAPKAVDVLALRDVYLREAALRVAPLQDAHDLGEATPGEAAELLEWKRYRIDLNRIDQQPGFPAEVEWPTKPE
jgi:hypothetical protein